MTKNDIENEPMLEENSDEVLLEETSGTEAMLEETSDAEVLLEEDSSESILLEEDSEVLLEEATNQATAISGIVESIKQKAKEKERKEAEAELRIAEEQARKRRAEEEARRNTEAESERRRAAEEQERRRRAEIDAKRRAETEATQRRMLMEAEDDAKKRRRKWGCISIIGIIIIFSLISSYIKSCQEENESENLTNTETVEAMLDAQFDYVYKRNNYFEVIKNEKYGFADLNGNVKIAPLYDHIGLEYDNYGVAAAEREGKYGLVSFETFTEVLEPSYDYIGFCNSQTDLLDVRKNGKKGLFSLKKMKEVTPCIYDYISYEGAFYIVKKGKKRGYLNLDGSINEPLK